MQKISNLKVENPSCIWGRVMGVHGLSAEYRRLMTEMNIFYHDVTIDWRSLMPPTLEEGQLCVALWAKSWCRAIVESVVNDPGAHQALCFLVDHGERIVVPRQQIRVAAQKFLQLPFRMKKFHLGGIKPTTLRVCLLEQAKLIPSSHWDSSATLYLHNLLKVSTQAEAVLLETELESQSTSIELYLTIRDIKICVNDDMVAKKFAFYIRESSNSEPLDEADQCPIMLPPNVLLQTPQGSPAAVMSHGVREDGRGAWSVVRPFQVINGDHSPCNPSDSSKDNLEDGAAAAAAAAAAAVAAAAAAAAAESDSSEETDSSLAKEMSLCRFLKFMKPNNTFHQVEPIKHQNGQLNGCRPKESPVVSSTCSVLEDRRLDSNHFKHQEEEETRSDNSGNGELKKNVRDSEEGWACSQGVRGGGRGAWSVACPSQEHNWKTFEGARRPEVLNRDHSPRNSSDLSKDNLEDDTAATEVERDSSEETDSSLAKEMSLCRFLKFMKPNNSFHQAEPIKHQNGQLKDCRPEESPVVSSTCSVLEDKRLGNNHFKYHEEEETRSDNSENGELRKRLRENEEDWACSRLMEWLNPGPLNPDPDAAPERTVIPSNPSKSGILAHSALSLQPCTSLDDAPITDNLRRVCRKMQYAVLSPTDCHSWPAVARGCNAIVISRSADQPLGYLAPLLSHIHFSSIFTSHTSSIGPIAVLLCPGWEKAQAVYDLLEETRVAQVLHPVILLLGIGKDEAKAVRIPKNCLLIVTTPFSLERLLSSCCFLFLRLYHLVLDGADQLFSTAPEQMSSILQHFQKVTLSKGNASSPQQVVAVAKQWTSHMEGLLAKHMPCPCIVITAPEEAALYGDVQQVVLMCLESTKTSVLLGALDLNPDVGQKTLIVANSAKEVEDIFKAASSKSLFCLQTHEGLTHQFDTVVQQWRKSVGSKSHVVLVTTNECLPCLGIGDATCVVHFSFPRSPKLYGSRLLCMAENFRNLSERGPSRHAMSGESPLETPMKSSNTRSLLLISESNARHVIGLLRYLRRTNASLPSELLSFAEGVHMAREDMKTDRPLCRFLKSFGACRDKGVCPDRHRIIPHLDHSDLPASGLIEVVPLFIKTASIFYGRIVKKEAGSFDAMAAEMALYYADKKPGVGDLMVGGMYAVQEDDGFHRVRVLAVPDRGDRLFFSVFARFIDVGKEEEVRSHQILALPEEFQSLPGQAVEIVFCRVKPVNAEDEWHPKVTRAVSQKIRGLQHRARAVLSLGNTVFVDLMVRVTEVPGLKTVINEYNVRSLILNTGMGTENPEHLDLIRVLSKESVAVRERKSPHMTGLEGGETDLGVGIQTEDKVVAEVFREAEVKKPALLETPRFSAHEPVGPTSSVNQSPVPAQFEGQGENPPVLPVGTEENTQTSVLSLHPQVRWHQTPDHVTVTIKLVNPECQRCDFFTDRVVYSGIVNGKQYAASLELQENIAADDCHWEMKSNEPVLKLVKQQMGCWERLVKKKNIFVAYDMEHLEDEVGAESGPRFMEKTGEEGWYVHSESGSESD